MDEEFLKAAKTGDVKKAQEFLDSGVNVHVTNPVSLTLNNILSDK